MVCRCYGIVALHTSNFVVKNDLSSKRGLFCRGDGGLCSVLLFCILPVGLQCLRVFVVYNCPVGICECVYVWFTGQVL